jgi:hypothetical protein
MTSTQRQILDELLRLLSYPDRWSYMKRASGEWIHTGKVFVMAFGPRLAVEVNGVPWIIPPEHFHTLREAAHPIFEKLVNGGAKGNEELILGFLKTAA